MTNSQTCPDHDTLGRLLLGKLPAGERGHWGDHLLHCDSCAAAAETITTDDDVTEALRFHKSMPEDDNVLLGVIERAKQLCSQTDTVTPEETLDGQTNGIEETIAPEDGRSVSSVKSGALNSVDIEECASFLAAAEESDELGRLGGYRVLEVMGIGGMGIVYRAEDPRLKRAIALKVMKPTIVASNAARERFLREAQAAAAINHDNIVTIYQVGEDRGVPFIAMRYLRGESLQQKLAVQHKLDPGEATRVGQQVAAGLAAAHEHGLIHRDIKPDNVWIEAKTGRAKILDFGLARTHDADAGLTQSGMVLGTPKYMAPEQAKAERVDHRCDLFSLGSVLYHLVSGAAPFEGGNLTATLIKVTQVDCQPLSTVCPHLNPKLADLIMRLLAKDPEDRPASAQQVADELASIERELETEQVGGPSPVADPTRPRAADDITVNSAASSAQTATLAGQNATLADTPRANVVGSKSSRTLILIGGSLIAVAIAFLGLSAAGFFVRVETDQGTLVVKVTNEDFETTVKGRTITLRNAETGADYTIELDQPRTSEPLKPGSYEFLVTSKQGFRTRTQRFEISKGENKEIEIWWEPSAKTASKESESVAATPSLPDMKDSRTPPDQKATADERAAKWILSIGGTLQIGVDDQDWVTVSDASELPDPPYFVRTVHLATNAKVDDEGLKNLRGLTHLHAMAAWDTSITDAGVANFTDQGRQVPPLRILGLHRTQVTDRSLQYFAGLPIRTLALDSTQVSDAELLSQFSEVKTLGIGRTSIPLDQLGFLQNFDQLGTLSIDGDQANAIAKSKISLPLNLSQLSIDMNGIDFDPKLLEKTPNLHSFSLSKTPESSFDTAFWSAIASLPKLTWLGIDGGITDDGLANLQSMPQLERWDLDNARVSGNRLREAFKQAPGVRTLKITHSTISDQDAEALSQLEQIQELDIRVNPISESGVRAIRKALTNCHVLSDHPTATEVPNDEPGAAK